MVSHPKHAKLGPKMEYEKAVADLADKRVELQAAKNHHRRCELMEGDAMAEWLRVNPAPSAEAVHRDLVAREQARKMERVAKGLPAEEPKAPTHGRTPLDQLFAARAKGNMNRRQNIFPPVRGPMFKV
jgi:hypothetical protein